jgi:hypothetical protein
LQVLDGCDQVVDVTESVSTVVSSGLAKLHGPFVQPGTSCAPHHAVEQAGGLEVSATRLDDGQECVACLCLCVGLNGLAVMFPGQQDCQVGQPGDRRSKGTSRDRLGGSEVTTSKTLLPAVGSAPGWDCVRPVTRPWYLNLPGS